MPAVTDLTWQQIRDAFAQQGFIQNPIIQGAVGDGVAQIYIDVSALLGGATQEFTKEGVVKAFTKLLAAARVAQEAANTGKAAGEKLAAFPAATTGTPSNGAVPITHTITARALLSSATQIVGTNV